MMKLETVIEKYFSTHIASDAECTKTLCLYNPSNKCVVADFGSGKGRYFEVHKKEIMELFTEMVCDVMTEMAKDYSNDAKKRLQNKHVNES